LAQPWVGDSEQAGETGDDLPPSRRCWSLSSNHGRSCGARGGRGRTRTRWPYGRSPPRRRNAWRGMLPPRPVRRQPARPAPARPALRIARLVRFAMRRRRNLGDHGATRGPHLERVGVAVARAGVRRVQAKRWRRDHPYRRRSRGPARRLDGAWRSRGPNGGLAPASEAATLWLACSRCEPARPAFRWLRASRNGRRSRLSSAMRPWRRSPGRSPTTRWRCPRGIDTPRPRPARSMRCVATSRGCSAGSTSAQSRRPTTPPSRASRRICWLCSMSRMSIATSGSSARRARARLGARGPRRR